MCPLYQYSCAHCGLNFEHTTMMSKFTRKRLCACGRFANAVISAPAVRGDLNDFSTENGGKGRWNPQLNTYVTSVNDAINKGRAKGWAKVSS